jgi:hypothetical protein
MRPANAGLACGEGLRDRRAKCRRTTLGAPEYYLFTVLALAWSMKMAT